MWEFVFCLTPSMLLFSVAMLFRSKRICRLVEKGTRKLTCGIRIIICSLLKLLHPCVFYTSWDQDAKIKLVYKPTALANYVIENCKAFACAPSARWPKADPHLQFFFNFICPVEDDAQRHCGITFTRDHLQIQDGGIVALDWAVRLKEQNAQAKMEHYPGERAPGCRTSTPPVVILIPNALGKITQNLLSLCRLGLQQGFYPVIFHRRGHGGCPLATPRYQEFGDPSDLVQAVLFVQSRHPSSHLFAISEGSGSGLLLSYLGERGSSSYLVAAACISPVFHGQRFFETPFPKLYHEAVLYYRKLQLSRYATALSSVMDIKKIFSCRSLQDMEKLMFCSVKLLDTSQKDTLNQGVELRSVQTNWAGYWERNEPLRDADEVALPVLCLCSTDDPFLPPAYTLPMSIFQNSPYFFLALTSQGSHCGFLQQNDASWSHKAVLEYFQVVTEFFTVEETKCYMEGFVGRDVVQGLRHKSGGFAHRRRKPTMLRRDRPVSGSQRQLSSHSRPVTFEEQETFTWNRSYTR
ncbi:protein ABHD15-like isoform X1 [Tachysurus fulvidraco]|uniref:protein ABHD15-like isoform X1 n=1 Tax=Tachysurus fulvidraco TaxID=1234273 RepID=UPI001FEE0CB1|nr:protein ABHD15-like isoform X1 [Tachysurus fulvidraco]